MRSLSSDPGERTRIFNHFLARLPDTTRVRFAKIRSKTGTGNTFMSVPKLRKWIGRSEWSRLSIADFTLRTSDFKPPPDIARLMDYLIGLSLNALSYLFYEHVCFVYLMPQMSFFDNRNRLHLLLARAARNKDRATGHRLDVWFERRAILFDGRKLTSTRASSKR
jgi:hypothetical protein